MELISAIVRFYTRHIKIIVFYLSYTLGLFWTVKFLVTWQATNVEGIRCYQIIKESQKATRNIRYSFTWIHFVKSMLILSNGVFTPKKKVQHESIQLMQDRQIFRQKNLQHELMNGMTWTTWFLQILLAQTTWFMQILRDSRQANSSLLKLK